MRVSLSPAPPCGAVPLAAAVLVALSLVAPAETSAQGSDSPSREEILEQATTLTRAREWQAVIELLEPARRADPDSAEVALLLGIAYFREGQTGDAEPLFRDLADHPDEEVAHTAQLFVGLIARRSGDEQTARRLFRDVAASSPVLADSAQELLHPAAGRRLSAAASLRSGADSNVPLLSSETVAPGSASPADVNLLATGAAVVWPSPRTDFRLLVAGAYRKQARLTDFDFLAGRAGAHYERAGKAVDLGAGYAFEANALGDALLSAGHAIDVRARRPGRWFAELAYALRVRTYYPDAYAGYSGDTHRGTLWVGGRFGRVEAAVAAIADGERAREPALTGWGAGAAARLEVRRDRLRLRAAGEVLPRRLGGRRDVRAEASASLSYAFANRLAWLLGASALSNRSTAPEFQHVKAAAYTGLELRL